MMMPLVNFAGESHMTATARILDWLGESRSPTADLVALTRQGIPHTTVKRLMEQFQLDRATLVRLLGASERTLARRLRQQQPLDLVESDRLVRFLRVATYAEEVFEDHDRAIAWFKSPNRALGGKVPLELLDTDAGSEQVMEILTRVDYGVYS
jgi:putative toxin-antitoxin system antitoxin component (TIGR02293 family)